MPPRRRTREVTPPVAAVSEPEAEAGEHDFIIVGAASGSEDGSDDFSDESGFGDLFNSDHVLSLNCEHCGALLSQRGQATVMVADFSKSLFSSDLPTDNAVARASRPWPITECACKVLPSTARSGSATRTTLAALQSCLYAEPQRKFAERIDALQHGTAGQKRQQKGTRALELPHHPQAATVECKMCTTTVGYHVTDACYWCTSGAAPATALSLPSPLCQSRWPDITRPRRRPSAHLTHCESARAIIFPYRREQRPLLALPSLGEGRTHLRRSPLPCNCTATQCAAPSQPPRLLVLPPPFPRLTFRLRSFDVVSAEGGRAPTDESGRHPTRLERSSLQRYAISRMHTVRSITGNKRGHPRIGDSFLEDAGSMRQPPCRCCSLPSFFPHSIVTALAHEPNARLLPLSHYTGADDGGAGGAGGAGSAAAAAQEEIPDAVRCVICTEILHKACAPSPLPRLCPPLAFAIAFAIPSPAVQCSAVQCSAGEFPFDEPAARLPVRVRTELCFGR